MHMNSPIHQRLVQHVTTIVNPVRAFEWRKDRMREELLNHLTDAEHAASGAGADPESSVAQVIANLGDTANLTHQLQQSVPAWERLLATPVLIPGERSLNRIFDRRMNEPRLRYAARTAAGTFLLTTVLLLILTPLVLLCNRSAPFARIAEMFLGVVLLTQCLNAAFTVLGAEVAQAVWPHNNTPDPLRAIVAALATGFLVAAGFAALSWLVFQSVPVTAEVLWPVALVALLAAAASPLASRLAQLEARRRALHEPPQTV